MDALFNLLATLAWVGLIAYLLAYKFQGEVSGLINRLRGVGFGGANLDLTVPPASQQDPTPESPATPTPSVASEIVILNPFYTSQEHNLYEALNIEYGDNTERKLSWLVRSLIITQAERFFEITYRNIFGSQIAALKSLVIRPPVNKEYLQQYYTIVHSNWVEFYKSYTFDEWLGFLINNKLIQMHEQESFSITPIGREFIKYLASTGLPENKPY